MQIAGSAGHVDLMPTVLELLQLQPAVPADVYSAGRPIPVTGLNVPALPLDRIFFGFPRWFPHSNRVLTAVDPQKKRSLMFRIEDDLHPPAPLQLRPLYVRDFEEETLESCSRPGTVCTRNQDLIDRAMPQFDTNQTMWRFLQPS